MSQFSIKLLLKSMSNSALLAFAQTVATAMTGNLSYPTPNPTLLVFGTDITSLSDAITALGTVHNRGSHAQLMTLRAARLAVENDLRGLQDYCENTTPNSPDAFVSAGFAVKSTGAPVGILPMVQNFRQFIGRTVPSGAVKLSWKRGLATNAGNAKSYKILRSLTADVNASEMVAVVTKTSWTDETAADRPTNFYWVIAVGTAGDGVISDVVQGYPTGPVVS